jgi:hypothetical protein
MTHPALEGPLRKTQWAKQHIDYLEAHIRDFIKGGPYELVTEDQDDTGGVRYSVRVHRDPPPEWGLIIGDAIHNLRSALDHVVYTHIERATAETPGRDIGFPVFDSEEKFNKEFGRKVKGASAEVVNLIQLAKPYPEGTKALWQLHMLDIIDKHQLLIPVGASAQYNTIEWMVSPGFKPVTIESFPASSKVYPLKDGAILGAVVPAITPPNTHMHVRAKFLFQVAFGEGQIVEGEAVIKALNDFADLVEGIVLSFEPFI